MEFVREIDDGLKIRQPEEILPYVKEFCNEDREYIITLGLDTKNKIIYRDIVAIGTLNSAVVHPREVFKSAVMKSANSIIFVHNHPSDDLTPSSDDISSSNDLIRAGKILGIKVIDCIIISRQGVNSFIGSCKESF